MKANDKDMPQIISVATSTTQFRVLAALNELHLRYRDLDEGAVATYIPELAKANPDWFAICVVTADGRIYEIGDADRQFTIQSVSKPFVYGLALQDHGREAVLQKVGVEPTGDAFNSIIKLDAANRPHNPCVNAGAIATTSLIKGADPTARLNRVLDLFGKYFGRKVQVDMSVFMSERTSGHRNRAIAYLMLNFGMIGDNVDQVLDLYFQQCSILGNCRDLAVMAATLANNGVNPITREVAVDPAYLRDILTVMYTCGMYDYAGQWGYSVGLPAKSGVAGSIIAVVPNQLGIAVYSPLLDDRGNSVRGIKVCQDLSQEFGMHMFDSVLIKTAENTARDIGAAIPEIRPAVATAVPSGLNGHATTVEVTTINTDILGGRHA
jgi:glutaminase